MTVVSDASPLHYLVLIEAEAIGLALEMRAKTLLIDERDGTRIARGLGVATAGTLGVLVLASAKNLLSLLLYFEQAPRRIFIRCDPLPAGVNPIWTPQRGDTVRRFVEAP